MAHRSAPRLLVLHGLRQLGTAGADRLAAHFECPPTELTGPIDRLLADGLLEERHGRFPGYRLQPEGRRVGVVLVEEELRDLGLTDDVARLHAAFEVRNDELLAICTDWQLRGSGADAVTNDHADAAYDDAVVARLAALHETVRPITVELSELLQRYAGHHHRLEAAVVAAVGGNHDYVTRTMFPSYHSCWHELHEDLLVSTGNGRD